MILIGVILALIGGALVWTFLDEIDY